MTLWVPFDRSLAASFNRRLIKYCVGVEPNNSRKRSLKYLLLKPYFSANAEVSRDGSPK